MKQQISIKGNKYGITIRMDGNCPFEDLLSELEKKLNDASKLFKNAKMAVAFEGRLLSEEEENILLEYITRCTDIQIVCVIDNDQNKETYFKSVIEKAEDINTIEPKPASHNIPMEALKDQTAGQFYKGTLRSGSVLESESSIIVVGDVNPGAKIVAKGNIIILGALKGYAFAGANGNSTAFVVALQMEPMQIRIGNIIARSEDKKLKTKKKKVKDESKIAFVENDSIYIEPISKDILSSINYH